MSGNRLSERAQLLQPSATMAITGRAKEMKQAGVDVISLSAGEPDFAAPATACQAAKQAIDEGFTHYTLVHGILPLRQAICQRLEEDFRLSYGPEDIVVGAGAKPLLYMLFQVLLNPGDEVLIPAPYWVSYPDQVRLAGGKPVILPTTVENHFVPQPQDLEKSITDKTRILVLNFPSNPSGAVCSRENLQALGKVLKKFPRVTVLSDEIYALLTYDGFRQESLAAVAPDIKDQVVTLNGMSKAYAMTGWRIGYAAGPKDIIQGVKKLQGQLTSNASAIAQRAALGALTGDQGVIGKMLKSFDQRRLRMVELLEGLEAVTCLKPRGAFYCFPDVSAYFGRQTPKGEPIKGSVDLAQYLLEQCHVALVPGEPFGAAQYMRLSFATQIEKIEEAIERIRRGLSELN